MISDSLVALFSLITGLILGIAFFGGLFLTVRKGMTARHPAVWFTASLLVRFGIVAVGLMILSDRQWQRLLIGLAGFILARLAVLRLAKRPDLLRRGQRKDEGP